MDAKFSDMLLMGNIFTGCWWVSWLTGQLSTIQSIQSVARQLGYLGEGSA